VTRIGAVHVPAPMSSTQPPSPPARQIPLAHLVAPPDPTRRFRLLELVRRRLRERRYSRRTEQAYVFWIRRYILFHDRRHPRHLGPEHVREFLSALAVRERVAASTQNQALAALRFLYERVLGMSLAAIEGIVPARRPRRMPVVLSKREMRALLARLQGPIRLCAGLMYGSGLRLLECLTLRVKDIDFDRREIVVRDGKGGKDRPTPLPTCA
jgi:integrase